MNLPSLYLMHIRYILKLLLLPLLLCSNALARDYGVDAYKAKYIQKLIQYTNWQDDSSKEIKTLCIASAHSEHTYFDVIAKSSGKRFALNIKYDVGSSNLSVCKILFIPYETYKKNPAILNIASKNPNILTIGEKDMAWNGAIIALYKKREKIEFFINLKALKKSNVQIHTSILEMADLIEE